MIYLAVDTHEHVSCCCCFPTRWNCLDDDLQTEDI